MRGLHLYWGPKVNNGWKKEEAITLLKETPQMVAGGSLKADGRKERKRRGLAGGTTSLDNWSVHHDCKERKKGSLFPSGKGECVVCGRTSKHQQGGKGRDAS